MKKILSVLVGMIITLNLSACFFIEHIDKNEIRELSDNYIELFVQKNAYELFNCFCSDIQENRKEDTTREMRQAFDFIDGNIVDYEFNDFGSEEEHRSDGKIAYFQCNPNYKNVLTDTGKKYTVRFAYCSAYKDHPEYEGLWRITIRDYDDDNKTLITVGQFYPPE